VKSVLLTLIKNAQAIGADWLSNWLLNDTSVIDARAIGMEWWGEEENRLVLDTFMLAAEELEQLCLMPPFRSAWYEHCYQDNLPMASLVIHFPIDDFISFTKSIDPTAYANVEPGDAGYYQASMFGLPPNVAGAIEERTKRLEMIAEDYKRIKHAAIVSNFVTINGGKDVRSSGYINYFCDENGYVVNSVDWVPTSVANVLEDKLGESPYMIDGFLYSANFPALRAMNLLNCKNVETERVIVPAPVRKKRLKKGYPEIEWKRLVVHVGKERIPIRYEANPQKGPPQTRLHVCRGHFRTYTTEAPLFGKYTGRYWIPQHTRGTKSLGEIHKVYDIHKEET
jgi:hypothetical protein